MTIPKLNNATQLMLQQFNKSSSPQGANAQGTENFSSLIKQEGKKLIDTMAAAEHQSLQSIAGQNDINNLVTALTDSRLALKTVLSLRRELLQAFNEIKQTQL